MTSGFSKFQDGSKFKYNKAGEVCFSTDCSSWAKRLLNNVPLHEYMYSESLVPPKDPFTSPNFGTQKKSKKRQERVNAYIDSCEFCSLAFQVEDAMSSITVFYKGKQVCAQCYSADCECDIGVTQNINVHRFHGKLVCSKCYTFLNRNQGNCWLCKKNPSVLADHFTKFEGGDYSKFYVLVGLYNENKMFCYQCRDEMYTSHKTPRLPSRMKFCYCDVCVEKNKQQ